MKRVSIEAFEDPSHPDGGHAVVLLRGLEQAPQPATFQLKIIDAIAVNPAVDGARLSNGDLEPARVRATPDGVELLIGPEVTACPMLMPGTAVEIVVAGANARGGFLWPSITPEKPRARRNVLSRKGRADPAHATEAAANGAAPTAAGEDATGRMSWRPARPSLLHRLGWRPTFAAGARRGVWAFTAAVAAGVIAVELGIRAVGAPAWLRPPRDAAPAAAVVQPSRALATDLSQLLMQSWLRTGPTSPRGGTVAGVNPTRALERAELHLADGGDRDTAEGAFWLRIYLAATSGESLHVRALTQLGQAHAAPTSGSPDHTLARQHWELAAAMGDANAMCLLSALYTNGRGVTADAVTARHWLERARRIADCPEQQP